MTVFRNRDAWDASNVALRGGMVGEYRKGAPRGTYEYIDYGMSILTAVGETPNVVIPCSSIICHRRSAVG